MGEQAHDDAPVAQFEVGVMAGLLGVALTKPGAYRLGDATVPVAPATIDEAWRLTRLAAAAMVLATLAAIVLRDAAT